MLSRFLTRARAASPTLARRLATTAAAPATPLLQRPSVILLAGGTGGVLLQTYFGTADDFFEKKYITNKNPDDIMEFYQAEDLLKIFTFGLPFIFEFVMGGACAGLNPGPCGLPLPVPLMIAQSP